MSSSPIRKQPRRSRSEALERERKLTELLQSSLMMMLGDNRKLLLRLESTEKANQDLLEHVEVLEKRTGIASPEGPHWLTTDETLETTESSCPFSPLSTASCEQQLDQLSIESTDDSLLLQGWLL